MNKDFFYSVDVWFPSDGDGGREGEGGRGREGGGGREGRGREGVETVVSKFILHHRRSIFCKRRIPSRLKEIRPSQSHALLCIRRKRRVRSSIL